MVETLFHVSDDDSIARFDPRPLPTRAAGVEPNAKVVWAIDAAHLHNYLLPRDCPRVTFYMRADHPDAADEPLLRGTTAARVIGVESGWVARIRHASLFCYELPAAGFACVDANAGYYVAREPVTPLRVRKVGDPLLELASQNVELRVMPSLWKLHDAVIGSPGLSYSIIRMRNAQPRP